MKIYKYEIPLDQLDKDDRYILETGIGKIISAGCQKPNIISIWAMIHTHLDSTMHTPFIIKGTGHSTPPEYFEFFTTVFDGLFIWHVFKVK